MKTPWPSAPKGRDHYLYSIGLVNPLICEQESVKLSELTRLIRVRRVTNHIGKRLLGYEAINVSNKLGQLAWNSQEVVSPNSDHVYAAFDHLGFPPSGHREWYCRKYEHSDIAIEVKFPKNDIRHSNDMYFTARDELASAVASLRLIYRSGVGIIGPVQVRAHPSIGGSAISLGSPEDPNISCFHSSGELLKLTLADCRELKRLFSAIRNGLPSPVELALRRLNLSSTRRSIEDAIVDSVIGLEAIYLPTDSGELRYRLSARCAAHLESDAQSRIDLFERIGWLYDVRSGIVHGNVGSLRASKKMKVKAPFSDEKEVAKFALDVLRRGLKKIILDLHTGLEWATFTKDVDGALLTGLPAKPTGGRRHHRG